MLRIKFEMASIEVFEAVFCSKTTWNRSSPMGAREKQSLWKNSQ
jgi:hypothetical protein